MHYDGCIKPYQILLHKDSFQRPVIFRSKSISIQDFFLITEVLKGMAIFLSALRYVLGCVNKQMSHQEKMDPALFFNHDLLPKVKGSRKCVWCSP